MDLPGQRQPLSCDQAALARDHSLLLEEQLAGLFGRSTSGSGPTSFAGLLSCTRQGNKVNEYGTLDEAPTDGQRPLQRFVSGIGRCLPTGVQLEVRHISLQQPPAGAQQQPADAMPPPAPRAVAQQQPWEEPVLGWLDFNAGRQPQQAAQQARQQQEPPQQQQQQQQQQRAAPVPPVRRPSPPVQVAAAEPVPGTLRIKLKLKRESSTEPRSQSPLDPALLQSVRQLGTTAPVSPIPDSWRSLARSSPPTAPPPQQARQQGAAAAPAPAAAAVGPPPTAVVLSPASGSDPSSAVSPFESVSVEEFAQRVSGDGLKQQQEATPFGSVTGPEAVAAAVPPQAQQPQAQQQQQRRRKEASPPAAPPAASAGAGTKRPASATAPAAAAAQGVPQPAKRRRPESEPAKPPAAAAPHSRPSSAQAAAGPGQEQQQQQQGQQQPASGGDDTQLGTLAGLLPGVLEPAAASAVPRSGDVQKLQEEGKKLKKFAEKRMKDGRPTHISSMFLCQSCVKFLTVAAVMEAHPSKFSLQNTSSMYSQTASLLDSCAHNAGRAEGPQLITQAIALLAARLAAVARLRSVHCLRSEGHQQVQAFRTALEKASGETFQRPSPTDSNTSTAMSVPLDRGQHSGSAGSPPAPPGGRRGSSQPPAGPPAVVAAAAAGGSAANPPLLGLPKGLLERQLVAAQHSQLLLGALEAFRRTGQQLREYMCRAAAQNNALGLKVAAATLLLSADAGMGPAGSVLEFAKDALDAVMQMQ
ncbi:hypothetical protein C2E21_0063 [Chlorella sorokiniana]|uniref:Uncharacterized protein n=1 Tax=Chlorella sorokiniana TaxID=3076 RepID=A0A2P6U4Y4_CHLSO|nr:hypothetical protein C2E21_0063 [Chlorella sorokiniana]|eukprot:PRW61367.1 hypothetical protein C2E21_0063 [Chlorella sorokiniana]